VRPGGAKFKSMAVETFGQRRNGGDAEFDFDFLHGKSKSLAANLRE